MASEQRLAREEAQRELDAEEIAHEFHATYERLAPRYGYETRKASAVDWTDVPQQNKDLMVGVVNDLLRRTVVLPRWMGVPEADVARLAAALAAREREVAGMREALEPFDPGAELLIYSKSGKPQMNAPLWYVGKGAAGEDRWVTVGDFLRVRAALAAPSHPDARDAEIAALREALAELRMKVLEADALAVKDEDADGFISAYHFQTGTWHRLLAYVNGEVYAALAASPQRPATGEGGG